MFYWVIRFFVRFVFKVLFNLKVYGLENIPKGGNYIFASNHKSYLDPMVVPVACHFRMGFVAKESLFRHKLLSFIIRNLGAFPIRRNASDIRAIKEILKRLKTGKSVLIFPEGTRASGDSPREVQKGVGFVAIKSGKPVIPVYIDGSEKILPRGEKKLKRYPLTVYFGKPFVFTEKEDYAKVSNCIMEHIRSLYKKEVETNKTLIAGK